MRSYSTLVSKCRIIEKNLKDAEIDKQRQGWWKNKREKDKQKGKQISIPASGNKFKRDGNKGKQVQMNSRFPTCNKCGKIHSRECLAGKGVCYCCGKPGHMIKDCP